jgi:hypothetical protein
MQENQEKEIGYLLKNISIGLKKHSVKELNQAIIKVLNKKDDKSTEIEFVIKSVAEKFNLPVDTLLHGKGRGKLQDAKHICYCLLHFDLSIQIRYIAQRIFFNWPNSVQKGIDRYKSASISTMKIDKQFIEIYTELQQQWIKFITHQK